MRSLLLALTLISLAACATQTGAIRGDGFHHAKYPATVRFVDAKRVQFSSPDWVIENFELKPATSGPDPMEWRVKDAYLVDRRANLCDPTSTTTEKAPASDLVLRSRTTDGRMWFTVETLPPERAETALDVLAKGIISSFTGQEFSATIKESGSSFTWFSWYATSHTVGSIEAKGTNHITRVLDAHDRELAGQPAYEAVFEVSNAEEASIPTGKAIARFHLILVQPPFKGEYCVSGGTAKRQRPLVTLLYANDLDHYDAGDRDFATFAGQLELAPSARQ